MLLTITLLELLVTTEYRLQWVGLNTELTDLADRMI